MHTCIRWFSKCWGVYVEEDSTYLYDSSRWSKINVSSDDIQRHELWQSSQNMSRNEVVCTWKHTWW